MKAYEALKKPGDVARRKSDGAIALRTGKSGCGRWIFPQETSETVCEGNTECDSFLLDQGDLTGDDWHPLGKVTPLESLRVWRASLYDGGAGGPEFRTDAAILVSDLQGLSLTSGDADMIVELLANRDALQLEVSKLNTENGHLQADAKELTTRVAELEQDVVSQEQSIASLMANYDELNSENVNLKCQLTDAEAELARLREGQVLGEYNAYVLPIGTELIIGKRRWKLIDRMQNHPDHMEFVEVTDSPTILVSRLMYPSEVQWLLDKGCKLSLPAPAEDVPSVPPQVRAAVFDVLEGSLPDSFEVEDVRNLCDAVCSTPELIAALAGSEGKE